MMMNQSLVSAIHALEKAGEGSRGGKVIGHTKSGKPIYQGDTERYAQGGTRRPTSKYMNRVAGMSQEDHQDTGNHHWELAKKAQSAGKLKAYAHHAAIAGHHQRIAKNMQEAEHSSHHKGIWTKDSWAD